jgi:type II secretory pathway component PulF
LQSTAKPLSSRELALFADLLAGLVRGRLPLPESFRALGEEARGKRFKSIVSEIEKQVSTGRPLPDALRASGAFPPLFVKLVEQGCATNGLYAALLEAAREYRAQSVQREELFVRLIGPASAAVLLGIVIVTLVYTKVISTLRELVVAENKVLPLPSQLLFELDQLLHDPVSMAWVAVILFAAAVGCWLAWRAFKLRARMEALASRLPVAGRYLKDCDHARLCRQLGALSQSGVTLPQALELAGECQCLNRARTASHDAADKVSAGMKLSDALDADPFFSRTLVFFVRGAELEGDLPGTLRSLSEQYQSQASIDAQKLNVSICVLATLFAGLCVGWFAIATMSPMMPGGETYRVQTALRKK